MSVFLSGFATNVPANAYSQDEILALMSAQFDPGSPAPRIMNRLFKASAIEKRHSCVWQRADGTLDTEFFDISSGRLKTKSTGVRNAKYTAESRPMFADTARKSIDASGFTAADVTHVITVSCTGFYAPGPEFYVVKDCGLNPSVQRFHLGFMGCFAAFPAWKLAAQLCQANPDAVVLVVCLELCTLHLQFKEDTDNLISGSVFADGAGACIVSGRKPANSSFFRWLASDSYIAPEGESDMAWTIGDNGFDMVLSAYIPRIIESNMKNIVFDALQRAGFEDSKAVTHWAIHPGGRAILDKVESSLELPDDALRHSREVLRNYGNMSSATILFVLKQLLDSNPEEGLVYASAFGPGLTIESAFLRLEHA